MPSPQKNFEKKMSIFAVIDFLRGTLTDTLRLSCAAPFLEKKAHALKLLKGVFRKSKTGLIVRNIKFNKNFNISPGTLNTRYRVFLDLQTSGHLVLEVNLSKRCVRF